jgi:hypothetical protein
LLAIGFNLPMNTADSCSIMKPKKNADNHAASAAVATIQWNTRVRSPYKHAAKVAAAVLDVSQDEIAEIALQLLVGADDANTQERRSKVIKAWRSMGEKLPFELLLTPCSNNALTVATNSATISAAKTDGVVAQLVEHHNGIVGGKASKGIFKTRSKKPNVLNLLQSMSDPSDTRHRVKRDARPTISSEVMVAIEKTAAAPIAKQIFRIAPALPAAA